MKRALKIIGIVFAVILLAVIALPFLINVNSFRPKLEAELSTALGFRDQRSFDLAEPSVPGTLPENAVQLVADAMQARPELASYRDEHDSALRLARAERALSFPTVSGIATSGVLPAREDTLHGRLCRGGSECEHPDFQRALVLGAPDRGRIARSSRRTEPTGSGKSDLARRARGVAQREHGLPAAGSDSATAESGKASPGSGADAL